MERRKILLQGLIRTRRPPGYRPSATLGSQTLSEGGWQFQKSELD